MDHRTAPADAGAVSRRIAERSLRMANGGETATCDYGGKAQGWRARAWRGLTMDVCRWHIAPGVEGVMQLPWHTLYVTLAGGTRRTRIRSDRGTVFDGPELPGQVSFVPAGRRRWGRYEGAWMEFAAIQLDPRWIREALRLEGGAAPPRWYDANMVHDPFIEGVAHALVDEVDGGGVAGPLFAESLALALALHLVRRYSERSVRALAPPPEAHDLSPVLAFIEERLDEPLPIARMAAVAGLAPDRFLRAFKRARGTPPHRYLMERRVERARRLLQTTDLPIAEVAAAAGLSSQSHLTTLFRRRLGLTPGAVRAAARPGGAPRT
ncbi:MAG: helix-turn-helix domain-containing protein [Pseudomonadota bacterium]